MFIAVDSLIYIVPLLIGVAYLTLVERKLIGSIQRRKGPNVVGWFGLLQPFADLLKLVVKQTVIPFVSNKSIFLLAPAISFFLSFLSWIFLPVGYLSSWLLNQDMTMLYVFACSSLGVYGIILSGWSSNSRYAFLGSLRSAAQVISYEVSITLLFTSLFVYSSGLNLLELIRFQSLLSFIFLFPILGFLFFISSLAETNRPPFDLPEAEAELVAGYFVEYSSMSFALFFVAEYSNILIMSTLITILFGGGSALFFFFHFLFDLLFIVFAFVWVRAAFPRYRYDQLMRLGWKVLLPLALGYAFMCFINVFLIF